MSRSIIVPLDITFKKLHDVLQIVFGWQDYHVYDFYIFDGEEAILRIVDDEEAFDYPSNIPIVLDTETKLSEYIPKYNRIKYIYDLGDGWEHYIEMTRLVDDCPINYPICISGEGNAPPEDVGGEIGYNMFLEAISDPGHEDHENMKRWAKCKDIEILIFNL